MTKKSNKKIAEMREHGKEIIDNLGDEIIGDNIEISELNDEIVDSDEISKLQRDEIIDDKIEINELKDKVIEEENIIEENKAAIALQRESCYAQEMKEMKIKVTENKMKKDAEYIKNVIASMAKPVKENKQNIKNVDFSAIEHKLNKLVEIKDLPVNVEGLDTVYLVKVAGIDIRLYVSIIEANRLYRFMKNIVTDVIIHGTAKVEVIQLKTNNNIYYLLKITGKNVKIYTSIEEATRVANYMTNVLNKVLNII